MTMTTFELLAEKMDGDCNYTVTIEESLSGLVRFNIKAESENPSDFNNSQGVDLTVPECEVIGKYLLALAKRLGNSN